MLFFLFHFLKHLPFIEDKPKLKKLQTMPEKRALEEAGETDENDEDEEIDKARRKTGYFCYRYVPFRNYQIFVIRVGYSCYNQQR